MSTQLGTDLSQWQDRPSGEQTEASLYLYVAVWSQTASNNEAEPKGHLSDEMLPSDGTGVLCQNVSAGSTYVNVLVTERC